MCKFADVLLNQYLTCWCEKMGDLSGLPVQVFGIFVHFDSYISRLDIHLLLLLKSVLISMRWGWNIHVPNFLPGACAACVTLGRHWARRAAAKMDVVVFGHIFQARRGEVRGGMVIPWSYLGHALVVSAMSTMGHRKYSTGASLAGYNMILCYSGRIPGEMLWKMRHMST